MPAEVVEVSENIEEREAKVLMRERKAEALEAVNLRKEKQLKSLEEQVCRERDNMRQQILLELSAETAALEKMKTEAEPKIEELKKVKSESETSLLELKSLQTEVNKQQEVLNQTAKDVAYESKELEAKKQSFKEYEIETRRILDDKLNYAEGLLVKQKEKEIAFEENLGKREAEIRNKEIQVDKALKDSQVQFQEASKFNEESERKETTLTGRLEVLRKQEEERNASFDAREQALASEKVKIEEREKSVTVREGVVTQREWATNQLMVGLEKSKVDIEIAQGNVRKRELLVEAKIKQHDLKEEIAALEGATGNQ